MQESEPSLQKFMANFKNGLNMFRLISLGDLLFSEETWRRSGYGGEEREDKPELLCNI